MTEPMEPGQGVQADGRTWSEAAVEAALVAATRGRVCWPMPKSMVDPPPPERSELLAARPVGTTENPRSRRALRFIGTVPGEGLAYTLTEHGRKIVAQMKASLARKARAEATANGEEDRP